MDILYNITFLSQKIWINRLLGNKLTTSWDHLIQLIHHWTSDRLTKFIIKLCNPVHFVSNLEWVNVMVEHKRKSHDNHASHQHIHRQQCL